MDRPTFVFEHQGQTHAVPVVIYVASTNSGGPPDTDNMLERVAHTDQLTIIVIVRFEHTQLAAMLLQAYRSKAQANDGRVSGGDIAATLQAVMASTDTDETAHMRVGRDLAATLLNPVQAAIHQITEQLQHIQQQKP